jgi:Zn-dependent protease with chaperone function
MSVHWLVGPPLVAWLAMVGAAYGAFRALAAVVGERGHLRVLVVLHRLGLFVVPVLAFGVLWLAGVPALVDAGLGLLGADLPGSTVDGILWPLVTGAGAVTVAVAAYLGTHPELVRVRDIDLPARTGAGRVLRFYLVVLVVLVLVIRGLFALADGPAWPLLLVVPAGLVLPSVLVPVLIRVAHPLRGPSTGERERLRAACEAVDAAPHAIRISELADAETPWATVRGVPGRRTLYVSDYLLEQFDDRALRGVVAVNWTRATHQYVELRVLPLVVLVAAGLWVVVAVPEGFILLAIVFIMAAPVLLIGQGALGRWIVYRSDRVAAEAAGTETVLAALERGRDLAELEPDWGPIRAVLKGSPSVQRRIEALERRAGESAGPAGDADPEPGD